MDYRKDEKILFARICSDRTRNNDFQLRGVRFKLDKEEIFTLAVMKHWNKFLKKAVDTPSLREDQDQIGPWVLSNLI